MNAGGAIFGWVSEITLWKWWVLGGVLLALELVSGTTYLLWLAAAAFATGLVLLGFEPVWQVQILIFAICAFAFTGLGRRFISPVWMKSDSPDLNEGPTRVVGRTAIATSDFTGGNGRVRLDDTVWGATAPLDEIVAQGEVVHVTGLDGTTLVVRRQEPGVI